MNDNYRIFITTDRRLVLRDIREEIDTSDFLLEVLGTWKGLIPKGRRTRYSGLTSAVSNGIHLFDYGSKVIPINVSNGDFIPPNFNYISIELYSLLHQGSYEIAKMLSRGRLKDINGGKIVNPELKKSTNSNVFYLNRGYSRNEYHYRIYGWLVYCSRGFSSYGKSVRDCRGIKVDMSRTHHANTDEVQLSLVQKLHRKDWDGVDTITLQIDGVVDEVHLIDKDGTYHNFFCIDEEEGLWEWVGYPINEHKELRILAGASGITKVEVIDD